MAGALPSAAAVQARFGEGSWLLPALFMNLEPPPLPEAKPEMHWQGVQVSWMDPLLEPLSGSIPCAAPALPYD